MPSGAAGEVNVAKDVGIRLDPVDDSVLLQATDWATHWQSGLAFSADEQVERNVRAIGPELGDRFRNQVARCERACGLLAVFGEEPGPFPLILLQGW